MNQPLLNIWKNVPPIDTEKEFPKKYTLALDASYAGSEESSVDASKDVTSSEHPATVSVNLGIILETPALDSFAGCVESSNNDVRFNVMQIFIFFQRSGLMGSSSGRDIKSVASIGNIDVSLNHEQTASDEGSVHDDTYLPATEEKLSLLVRAPTFAESGS